MMWLSVFVIVLVGNEMSMSWSWFQSGAGEACESASWFKYATWLSMSQFKKGGVIESIISNMIWQEASFGLSRVYYVRDLGYLNVLYTAYGQGLRPYESTCIFIFIFIYICDDMNICYLLLIFILSTECMVAQPLHLLLFPKVWLLLVAYRLIIYYAFQTKCVYVLQIWVMQVLSYVFHCWVYM